MGLEPTTFGTGNRRAIHYATRPSISVQTTTDLLTSDRNVWSKLSGEATDARQFTWNRTIDNFD